MSVLCPTAQEARDLVFSAAEPCAPAESIKAKRRRSLERLGMHRSKALERRHKAAWYGEAGCWGDDLMRDLKARYARWRSAEERKTHDVRNELAAHFEALAERLARTDPAVFREIVERLGHEAAHLRGVARHG